MAVNLTNNEINKLSLGYNWNPNMSQLDFIKKNNLDYEEGIGLFKQIDNKYIQYVYAEHISQVISSSLGTMLFFFSGSIVNC